MRENGTMHPPQGFLLQLNTDFAEIHRQLMSLRVLFGLYCPVFILFVADSFQNTQ